MVEDYRDPDVLRRLYYDEGLTLYEIVRNVEAALCMQQYALQVVP